MKTLTLNKPYDVFDFMKSNLDNTVFDSFFYPNLVNKKTLSNIKEMDDHVSIEMLVPGFRKNEIEISLENNQITITGTKEIKNEKENHNFILNEYNMSSFSRNFKINPNLNSEEITSVLEDGILKVKVPKIKKTENKKLIKIE